MIKQTPTNIFEVLNNLHRLPKFRKYKAFRALVLEFKKELKDSNMEDPQILLLQRRPVDEFIQILEAYENQEEIIRNVNTVKNSQFHNEPFQNKPDYMLYSETEKKHSLNAQKHLSRRCMLSKKKTTTSLILENRATKENKQTERPKLNDKKQKRYEYYMQNCKQYALLLNRKRDAEIIALLDSADNKIDLIRKALQRELDKQNNQIF